MDPLRLLLVTIKVRDLIPDPGLCLRGHVAEKVGQPDGPTKIIHNVHHEEQAADYPAIVVLHAVLPRIHCQINLSLALGEKRAQGVADVYPGGPDVETVEPRVGVGGAPRANAVFAIRTGRDVGTEVAQVHLTCIGAEDVGRLTKHKQQDALDENIEGKEQIAADCQAGHCRGPADASCDLRNGHCRPIDRRLLNSDETYSLNLHQETDRLPCRHLRIVLLALEGARGLDGDAFVLGRQLLEGPHLPA
mmetsp:Transcript_38579/g.81998  ORF Transcript_38579/g.81998 Transcript_38579/m.81998 type:complete len:248 (+) Transcript_38579:760-1503(+)